MNLTYFKIIQRSFLLFVAVAICSFSTLADPTFYLKIEEVINTETECVLEISIAGSEAMALGSSNLQFLYNEMHLSNPTLVSTTLGALYGVSVTEPTTTKASLNIELFVAGAGNDVEAYPIWTVLGQVHFDVLSPALAEEITWSYTGTTIETVVYIDDESTQIFVGDPDEDLIGVLHGTTTPVVLPEITNKEEFRVFPNPFNDHIRLERTVSVDWSDRIILSDSNGKTLREWKFPANEQIFSLDQLGYLTPGLYFIRIDTGLSPVTLKLLKF